MLLVFILTKRGNQRHYALYPVTKFVSSRTKGKTGSCLLTQAASHHSTLPFSQFKVFKLNSYRSVITLLMNLKDRIVSII